MSSKRRVILQYALWYGSKRQEVRREWDVRDFARLPEEGEYEVVFRDHTMMKPGVRHRVRVGGKLVRELFCSSVIAWRTDLPILNKSKYILGHNFIVIHKQRQWRQVTLCNSQH